MTQSNQTFYEKFFPSDFWTTLDRTSFVTDDHSMLGDHQAFDWIIKTVQPHTIVELGTWKGHSANYMADRCKEIGLGTKVVCVDTFLGGPEHWVLSGGLESMRRRNGMPTILDAFYGNTIARGNEGRIFPLTVDTTAAWHIMRDMGFKADLIFLDAGHAYEQVVGEVEGYLPLLTEKGVMFGDDYQEVGVANAVHDMANKYGFQVAVVARKWIFVTQSLLRHMMPSNVQLRISREGWVHP